MKKTLLFAALATMGVAASAQNIVVNLADGNKVEYSKDEVANVEFVPSASDAVLHYATTDMSYGEFFAGELRQPEEALVADGVDAFTSATNSKAKSFASHVVSEDGKTLSGVRNVSVAMTDDVYSSLTDEERARFTFVTDSVFAEYKMYKGDKTFGAYNSRPQALETTVSLSGGAGVTWGNYLVKLGIDRTAIPVANLQGVVVTTTNGQRYAFAPLSNLWLNTAEMAFSVKAFTEPHGNTPHYTHTAGLQGKTISNITYLLKDFDNMSIDCNVYVKQQSIASVGVDGIAVAGENPVVSLVFGDVPADAQYALATVKKGSGKGATVLTTDGYSYSDGKLTINGNVEEGAVYNVVFDSDKYISIGTAMTFTSAVED